MPIELQELLVPDMAAWRAWLLEHHESSHGVWLVLHKKGGDVTTLTLEQAQEEALCFGWIDGQAASRDAGSYRIRMTPRRPKSAWSGINVARIERLEREGRMTEAGRAQVRAAQADGRWALAYGGPNPAAVPADLAEAIAANADAQAMFDVLTSTNREILIYRVNSVKRQATRERKIAEFVAMLARGETLFPQAKRPDLPQAGRPSTS